MLATRLAGMVVCVGFVCALGTPAKAEEPAFRDRAAVTLDELVTELGARRRATAGFGV